MIQHADIDASYCNWFIWICLWWNRAEMNGESEGVIHCYAAILWIVWLLFERSVFLVFWWLFSFCWLGFHRNQKYNDPATGEIWKDHAYKSKAILNKEREKTQGKPKHTLNATCPILSHKLWAEAGVGIWIRSTRTKWRNPSSPTFPMVHPEMKLW